MALAAASLLNAPQRWTDMRAPQLALFGFAAAALGCIPLYPTVRRATTGTVVDARAGRPVSGATVRVESFRVPTPPGGGWGIKLVRSIEVKTDASGHWSVPSGHEWTIGILAADGLPLYTDVYCVLADGFATDARTAHRGWLPRSSSVYEVTDGQKVTDLRMFRPAGSAQLSKQPGAMTACGVAVDEGAVQRRVADLVAAEASA